MQDFLKFLITPLLSQPKALKIEESGSQITIQVAPDDTGRVIGKQGSVINAIRTLSKTYCAVHKQPSVNITLLADPKQ